jgi:tetratricopeptide (TPR) repeat protein
MEQLRAKLSGVAKADYFELQAILTFIKEERLRAPEAVSQVGNALITRHKQKLGDQVWSLYETTLLAALDCHDTALRKQCLVALKKKFPSSIRVARLEAMVLEATGQFKEAHKAYDNILGDDPADAFAMKRKVCVYKASGDMSRAIKELCKYVKVFSSDEMGWQELFDMYVQLGKYELAKFCMEELIMICPENCLYHTQYAEVLYTMGGQANFELARQYYAQSLELKKERNLRALYGLCLCVRATRSSSKSTHAKLYEWSMSKIADEYKQCPNALLGELGLASMSGNT